MHFVTLITGDGIGPELCEAVRRCIDATGVEMSWDAQAAGAECMARFGTPIPESTLASIRRNRVALKGPVSTPAGSGLRSVNVHLRQALDLYACIRPCKYYAGVRAPFAPLPIDLVVIRENTEDLYAGVEFAAGMSETKALIETISGKTGKRIRPDSGLSIKPISEFASRRIIKFAFDYARKLGRKKVTAVHKANIMRYTDGLFLNLARSIARSYTELAFDDRIVDNMCMQLVQKPEQYDVLVMPNLYGDIVSDLAAGVVGGLSVAPAGNIGEQGAVFEATHGSAPKYKGQNKVNPTALILAGTMMLRHLGELAAADRLENAVAAVLREGNFVTYDLKPTRDDPTAAGTSDMVEAIVAKLHER